jgi:hypothetical protein
MSTDTTAAAQTADQLDDGKTIDVEAREVKAPDNALVILNPGQFATELFQPFQDQLTAAKRKAGREKYDITTKEGLAKAKELKATFVTIRTSADKAKTAAKRPIDESGKKILEHYKKIEDAAKAEEAKHAEAIAAEEKRQADERQRKLDEERERVERLEAKVDALRQLPQTCAGLNSDQLRDAIDQWTNHTIAKADYEDYFEDAVIALEEAIVELRKMLDNALKAEAAARQAEADRQELERLRAEQAQREAEEAERKRVADEAAAEQQRQLVAQQEALARSQQIMAGLMDIQQRGMLEGDALTLHKAIVELQQLDVGARNFDNMASMAAGARDMSINALTQRYQARLALELEAAHAEALDVDAEREAIAGQAARTAAAIAAEPPAEYVAPDVDQELAPAPRRAFAGFGYGLAARVPADVPAPPVAEPVEYVRPSDDEMVKVLAAHYDEDETIVRTWMRDFKG